LPHLNPYVNAPNHLLERVIDNLFCSSFEEIENTANYIPHDQNDINDALAGNLEKFLLKLSDRQQEYLDLESDAPILIKGGPGTGKSVLAIYRTRKYIKSGDRSVLFSTYTQELADYSKELLCRLLATDEQGLADLDVEIRTADNLAITFFTERYGSPNLISQEIALYCLRQAMAMVKLKPRGQRDIFALGSRYILEEIQLVIEARGLDIFDKYVAIKRYGRKYPLNRLKRQAIWEIYEAWKKILAQSGYTTIEQVRAKALEIAKGLEAKPYKRVLIDEAQELSPITLKFLAELVSSPERLYLTADVQQSLYQRSFSWEDLKASLNFNGVEKVLRRSFRNTCQIGKACPKILLDELPEVNDFSELKGNMPQIYLTDSPIKQAEKLLEFFKSSSKEYRLPIHSGVILTYNQELGRFIASQLSYLGLKSQFVERKSVNHDYHSLKVMKLEASKGLEFPFVAIVGLEEEFLPNTNIKLPEEEKEELIKQERQLFYVGCSRAMRTLLVCGSKSHPSQFLTSLKESRYWYMEESNDD
jgi:superfamily I DNA/RNA helicase